MLVWRYDRGVQGALQVNLDTIQYTQLGQNIGRRLKRLNVQIWYWDFLDIPPRRPSGDWLRFWAERRFVLFRNKLTVRSSMACGQDMGIE